MNRIKILSLTVAACAVFALSIGSAKTAGAATLTAIDDTILLRNATPGNESYGGRNEIILGNNESSTIKDRNGLFRFDVSSIADQIIAGTDITSATLTLTEIMTRDSLNGNQSRTFSVFGVESANEGWVEGTANGTTQAGSASYSHRVYSTTRWASNELLFTFGTDTGSALGSGTVNFVTGSRQTLVITIMDVTELKTLLGQWLAADTNAAGTNAGLAIQSAGNGQVFFESAESGAGATPAQLDITFAAAEVPVPAALPAGLALLGWSALKRRR